MGSPVNDNRGDKVLSFVNKSQLKFLNDGRHTRISSTWKSAIDITIASPSVQPILSWNVTDSPLCCDHCMITVNIQSKIAEPQTTIRKFNTKRANWHPFTSIEAWKEVTNPNQSQSAEALTKDFYRKKKTNFRKICLTSDRKKTLFQPLVEWSTTKNKR